MPWVILIGIIVVIYWISTQLWLLWILLLLACGLLIIYLYRRILHSEWWEDRNRRRAAALWEAKFQSDVDKRRLEVTRLANELAQEWEAAPPLPTPDDFVKVVCRDLPLVNATLLSQVLTAQKSIFADVRIDKFMMRPADARRRYKLFAKACIDGIRAFSSKLPNQLRTPQTGPALFSRTINLTDADLEAPLYELAQPFRAEWVKELFGPAKMQSTELFERVRRQNYEHTPEGDREYNEDVKEYQKQEDAVLKTMRPIDRRLHYTPYYTRASLFYPRPITVPFPLHEELRFQGHWIIGTQGSGKTTLLRHMFLSDLEKVAAGRASVVLMDSKEDLFKFAKLKRFAKGGDLDGKLVILSPEEAFPLALNPLDLGASTGHTLDLLEHVFASLRDTKQTALQSTLFRSIFLLLINVPGASLADFRKVLTDGIANYQQCMHKLHPEDADFFMKPLADGKTEFNSKAYVDTRGQLLWRLRDLTTRSPLLRELFNAPATKAKIADLINSGKVIIIIDNARRKLGPSGSEFFARFFLALIRAAADQRSELRNEDKMPTYVYMDECQTIIANDENVEGIIAECRSQKIALIMAHQFWSQIPNEKVKSALTNCAIRFANVDEEAAQIAPRLRVEPQDIQLTRGEFYAFLRDTPPTSARLTIPPPQPLPMMTEEDEEDIMREMRKQYCWQPRCETDLQRGSPSPNANPAARPTPDKPLDFG